MNCVESIIASASNIEIAPPYTARLWENTLLKISNEPSWKKIAPPSTASLSRNSEPIIFSLEYAQIAPPWPSSPLALLFSKTQSVMNKSPLLKIAPPLSATPLIKFSFSKVRTAPWATENILETPLPLMVSPAPERMIALFTTTPVSLKWASTDSMYL